MRSHLLTATAIACLTLAPAVALAADLPARSAPPVFAPPPPIPVFTWTGIFVGGNAGAAFDERRSGGPGGGTYDFPAGSIAGSAGTAGTLNLNGTNANGSRTSFAGGGQIGYNYEIGNLGRFGGFGTGGGIVVGIVADAQYLDQHQQNQSVNGAGYTFRPNSPLTVGNAFVRVPGLPRTIVNTTSNFNGNTDFFGTVRGRLGVAFDRIMVYGTGGLAYNTHATGYAAGGGLEYAVTNHVSIGGEYLYVNISQGRSSSSTATYVPSPGLGAGTLTINQRFSGGRETFSLARAFVNYKFDTIAPAPVVARY